MRWMIPMVRSVETHIKIRYRWVSTMAAVRPSIHAGTAGRLSVSVESAIPLLIGSSPLLQSFVEHARQPHAGLFDLLLHQRLGLLFVPGVDGDLGSGGHFGQTAISDLLDRKSTRLNSSHLGISYA